ncbi:KdsC family phosphatase [Aurantibacter sp.]|uniref:KdsC family phosphatase n=1 Tax=Aurantibacter sp. TaxID=2807103 RepID=UPI0035C8019F
MDNAKSYKEYLHQITTFIFDVDGVLTNGDIQISENGELLRTMNVKDGFGVKYAIKQGYNMAIISAGTNQGVKQRLETLGITNVFLDSQNKLEVYNSFVEKHNLKPEEILYVGDDIMDIEVMKLVGLACCPQDAVPEVKQISNYISHKNGGKGCVREIIEQVLKVQNKWNF